MKKLVFTVGFAAFFLAAAGPAAAADAPAPLPSAKENVDTDYNAPVTTGVVGDVLKGDELTLQDGTEIRMIGIKTPIAAFSQRVGEYYGKGAIDLTKKLAAWKSVKLEYDTQVHDRRGRLLAYVYVGGKFVQEELLKNGLAVAEAFPPNTKYREKFAAWQKEAMLAKKGLWGLDPKAYPVTNKVDDYMIEGAIVKRVLNGDSIELDDGTVVRYLGIDAPDSENRAVAGEVGNTAYNLNKQLVWGKELKIEYDVETKDPRGRDLAWVWVGDTLINAEIVKNGEAWVSIFPPNLKYIQVLFKAQDEAAKAKKGLWAESAK